MDNLIRDWSEEVRAKVPGLTFNVLNIFDYYIVRVNRNSYESLNSIAMVVAYHELDNLMKRIESIGKQVLMEVV